MFPNPEKHSPLNSEIILDIDIQAVQVSIKISNDVDSRLMLYVIHLVTGIEMNFTLMCPGLWGMVIFFGFVQHKNSSS